MVPFARDVAGTGAVAKQRMSRRQKTVAQYVVVVLPACRDKAVYQTAEIERRKARGEQRPAAWPVRTNRLAAEPELAVVIGVAAGSEHRQVGRGVEPWPDPATDRVCEQTFFHQADHGIDRPTERFSLENR